MIGDSFFDGFEGFYEEELDDSENTLSPNLSFNNLINSNDNDLLTEEICCSDEYFWSDDSKTIQMKFVDYIKQQELNIFNESFVEKYFCSYNTSVDDIIKRTRTQLWMDNCIYGLQFQAYLCMMREIPLPTTPQSIFFSNLFHIGNWLMAIIGNRKFPIVRKKGSVKRKGIISDVILEYLLNQCKKDNGVMYTKHRDAPSE